MSFSPFVLFFSRPHFSLLYPYKIQCNLPVSPVFFFTAFIWHAHWHSHSLSHVPLSFTGEWSLITVHGLYDKMPHTYLTSSCQLPLTSHCLHVSQTVFASQFSVTLDSHLETLFCSCWITMCYDGETLTQWQHIFAANVTPEQFYMMENTNVYTDKKGE